MGGEGEGEGKKVSSQEVNVVRGMGGGGRETETRPVFHSQSLQGEDRCRLDPCSCQLQDGPPVHTIQQLDIYEQFDRRGG